MKRVSAGLARWLEIVILHTLRHSQAWWMLERGANLTEVHCGLGHSRLLATAIYLTLSKEGYVERFTMLASSGDSMAVHRVVSNLVDNVVDVVTAYFHQISIC